MDTNYEEFKKLIEELKTKEVKPTLLLHSCCGPCSSHILMMLKDAFDISVLYYNPNIYPEAEFDKRVFYQQKIIDAVDSNIKLIVEKDSHDVFLEAVKEYATLGEGSLRCYNCYEFRIKHLADMAKEKRFDYYSTVMSVSPYKNSDWINEILKKYESENTKALYSNFKKENGYQKTIEYSIKYDLYRQDWCGCEYSLKEHEERMKVS